MLNNYLCRFFLGVPGVIRHCLMLLPNDSDCLQLIGHDCVRLVSIRKAHEAIEQSSFVTSTSMQQLSLPYVDLLAHAAPIEAHSQIAFARSAATSTASAWSAVLARRGALLLRVDRAHRELLRSVDTSQLHHRANESPSATRPKSSLSSLSVSSSSSSASSSVSERRQAVAAALARLEQAAIHERNAKALDDTVCC